MKIVLILLLTIFSLLRPSSILAANQNPYWDVQSVDTMKLSRDLARQMIFDTRLEGLIDPQVKKITEIGATHVAIATPSDKEFLPVVEEWISAARKYGIKVWFRGNMSGWEGWFGYGKISKEAHRQGINDFITNNPQLFEDGDIFTPCPECENGGPGDPRTTGDTQGFREFLLAEYEVSASAFKQIGKNVKVGYFSMNGDVAKLVMDKETTQSLGGIVSVDHYVKTPEKLANDVEELANLSGGKVILGEMGVPIPDIHGYMTNDAQAQWLEQALNLLSKSQNLIGINYWTASHGSTALWFENGSEKPAVFVLSSYYQPKTLNGRIMNEIELPVKNAEISIDAKRIVTDTEGRFSILQSPGATEITVKADTYYEYKAKLDEIQNFENIVLKKESKDLFYKLLEIFYNFGYRFPNFRY